MEHSTFFKAAVDAAQNSKCQKRKVGAVTVSHDNEIICSGYNHVPVGDQDLCETDANISLPYVIHAESAAIISTLHRNIERPKKIYVTFAPCIDCCKLIIQADIETLHYIKSDDDSHFTKPLINGAMSGEQLLKNCNIEVHAHEHAAIFGTELALVYHSKDVDGFMGGWLMSKKYSDRPHNLIPYNREKDGHDLFRSDAKEFVFVDVTPPVEWIEEKLQQGIIITIYDHHETVYYNLAAISHKNYTYNYSEDTCASKLYYMYNNFDMSPSEGLGNIISLVDEYDLFKFNSPDVTQERRDEVLCFNAAMKDKPFSEFSQVMDVLSKSRPAMLKKLINEGKPIVKQQKNAHMKELANGTMNSENMYMFSGYPNEHSEHLLKVLGIECSAWIGINFKTKTNLFSLSIRTPQTGTLKASHIAQQYGGGGHEHAAGAKVDYAAMQEILNK